MCAYQLVRLLFVEQEIHNVNKEERLIVLLSTMLLFALGAVWLCLQ